MPRASDFICRLLLATLIFQTRRCPVRRAASPRRALRVPHPARLRCSPNTNDDSIPAAPRLGISTLNQSASWRLPTNEESLVHDGAAPAEVDGMARRRPRALECERRRGDGCCRHLSSGAAVTIQAHARRRAQASRSQAQHDPTDSPAASLRQPGSQQPPESYRNRRPATSVQPEDHRRRHRYPRTHPRTPAPRRRRRRHRKSIPEAADTIVTHSISASQRSLRGSKRGTPVLLSDGRAAVAQPVDQG